jgi:hypothetical protein
MKILLSLDESGATSERANSGAVGAVERFLPMTGENYQADQANRTPGEGLPTLSDGLGGRAAITAQSPTSHPLFGDYFRVLYSTNLMDTDVAEDSLPVIPTGVGQGFSFGGRFRWVGPYTEGLNDEDNNIVWEMGKDVANAAPYFSMGFVAQDDTDESQGAQPMITWQTLGQQAVDDTESEWDSTGSPAQFPIVADVWHRMLVISYWNAAGNGGAGGVGLKVYVYSEGTGATWVWTLTDAAALTVSALPASRLVNWKVGHIGDGSGSSVVTAAFADVDEVWFYADLMTDDEATGIVQDGLTIPWVEPNYHREAAIIHSAVTKENADFPVTRVLPAGETVCRHPTDVLCQEARARLEGWRAGQPWALRKLEHVFDPSGPYGSKRARRGEHPDLSVGVWRSPGAKPYGACEDARNVEFTFQGPRRRRGFKIRRDVDSTETGYGFNSFHTFRDYNDELFRCYKVGSKVYADTGSVGTAIATGWNTREIPSTFVLDGRLVMLSPTARGIWDGGAALDTLGVAAPASIAVAAASGGTLDGAYYYAVTLYDPTSGDESGPIVSALVSPSTQKVTLTLPSSAPESRFSQYRIYRTTNGGVAPNFLLILTATVAASIDDTGAADGTQTIPQVTGTDGTFKAYITGDLPDTFAIGISHLERAIYAKGATNPERIYIAEPNEPQRFFADQWIAADGPVRALASWQGRIVVFTDNTVEIVESDFVRDSAGALNISRTVVSRSVGAFGQSSVITYQGNIFWLESRGAFTMQGTNAVPLSNRIRDLFPYINTNLGAAVVGGWNHMTRTLWWTLPCAAFQSDSALMQTQFVTPVDEPEKWYFHSLEATYVQQFDDDLNGIRFGCIDHAGIFKELESYEGDGQEGNESGTFEDDGTDDFATTPAGLTSVSNAVIAVEGSPAWTTDEHRGKGCLLRDRSTGKLYYHTIRSNTAEGLTFDRSVNALLAAGDGYYIGGMDAFLQFAGHDFGTANRKIMRQVQYTFADLTREELYL